MAQKVERIFYTSTLLVSTTLNIAIQSYSPPAMNMCLLPLTCNIFGRSSVAPALAVMWTNTVTPAPGKLVEQNQFVYLQKLFKSQKQKLTLLFQHRVMLKRLAIFNSSRNYKKHFCFYIPRKTKSPNSQHHSTLLVTLTVTVKLYERQSDEFGYRKTN